MYMGVDRCMQLMNANVETANMKGNWDKQLTSCSIMAKGVPTPAPAYMQPLTDLSVTIFHKLHFLGCQRGGGRGLPLFW